MTSTNTAIMDAVEKFPQVAFENMGGVVYGRLTQALMEGRLQPGERLKIRELAESMGTSVTPIRDAILRLVQDGGLVLRSARDIRVCSISLKEYLEIRAIRVELEGMAAARAAELATAADVARLEQLVSQNEDAIRERNFPLAISLNQAFHFEYCRIANMPVLQDILQRLWLKMGPLIGQVYEAGGRDMIDHHYPALKAFRQRDGDAARIAIQTDIMSGGQCIFDFKQTVQAPDQPAEPDRYARVNDAALS